MYYHYDTVSPAVGAGAVIAFILLMIFIFAIAIGAYVVMAIFMGKIFKKAGVPAWMAWVPFLNSWKFLEIGGQQGWLALLALTSIIPFVGWIGSVVTYVFMSIAAYNIGLKLGKTGNWVIMYIFLAPVWLIIMGIDHNPWNEAAGAPSKATETAAMYAAYYGNQQTAAPAQPVAKTPAKKSAAKKAPAKK